MKDKVSIYYIQNILSIVWIVHHKTYTTKTYTHQLIKPWFYSKLKVNLIRAVKLFQFHSKKKLPTENHALHPSPFESPSTKTKLTKLIHQMTQYINAYRTDDHTIMIVARSSKVEVHLSWKHVILLGTHEKSVQNWNQGVCERRLQFDFPQLFVYKFEIEWANW